ncbi:Mss4-like protein [Akanthomyces lecanii RCEF 1005]|uniref:Mss4-like protein n=1 Tax=Akanthomyces lecanii RCEF 1005 TaxID=1081108 RepID=A0A168DRY7_CORDF|nr:Mss4-like protein [Akanthomyces lecanii RCEF 1005]
MAGQFAVNIRAIQDVNPFELESNLVMKPTNEPKRDFETIAKLYMSEPQGHETASCYCGKLRAELLFPLAEQEMKEDNCSSCVRTAYIGVYPTRDQVRILGREHTFEYIHGRRYGGAPHCKDCGVSVFGSIYGPDPSVFDKLAPERRAVVLEVYHKNMALQPVDVRTIEGLDLSSITVERSDEGTEGYVLDD